MVKYLHAEVDREALSKIPPPSWWGRLAPWLIPLVVLALFYRSYASGQDELEPMLLGWVVANSVSVGVCTLVARAKLLTALLAALAAPLLALVPHAGGGSVAAWVEAWLRRPGAADSEGLSRVSSFADWYQNRFTRVLLVGVAGSIGALLGAVVGAVLVFVFS
jgi:pheromone shutdown protein TraB